MVAHSGPSRCQRPQVVATSRAVAGAQQQIPQVLRDSHPQRRADVGEAGARHHIASLRERVPGSIDRAGGQPF